MFFVNPLFLVVDRVPENELSVHPSTRHELQFRHRDHASDHFIYFFLIRLFVLLARLALFQSLLKVSLQVPHENVAAFLAAV